MPGKPKTVLVTGANGFIGRAVARAFVRAGWRTYGLVRRPAAALELAKDEILPLVGSPEERGFLAELERKGVTMDVVVSVTEDLSAYATHFAAIMELVSTLSKAHAASGATEKTLLLYSSGCKDYGQTKPGEGPHDEQAALDPPALLAERTFTTLKVLDDKRFDALVLRPTLVYGQGQSYMGPFFAFAAEQRAAGGKTLELKGSPATIVHSLHVDDCGDAYVALASHIERSEIAGQCFNISSSHPETAGEIADALVPLYGFDGVSWVEGAVEGHAGMLLNFSQWVGSKKLRDLTGWGDTRASFVDALESHKAAYEAHHA